MRPGFLWSPLTHWLSQWIKDCLIASHSNILTQSDSLLIPSVNPIFLTKVLKGACAKAFVKPLANCWLVEIYLSSILPLLIWSLRKWYLMSMCLVRWWNSGFWLMRIQASLSSIRVTLDMCWCSGRKVLVIDLRKIASLAASAAAIYSASAVDRATQLWRFDLQLIGAPWKRDIYFPVNLRSSRLPAQLESVYPVRF